MKKPYMVESKVRCISLNIEKIRQEYMKEGYTRANATAKVCQDIILNEIAKSSYFKNVTIKGGVVMHNISADN